MPTQFTSQHLLFATSLIALTIGGGIWGKRIHGIDPSSETVFVIGKPVTANWTDSDWHRTTGLYLPATQFASPNWSGQTQVEVHQPLLAIAYNNYLGQEVYRATIYLDGHRTSDWKEYLIQPLRTGGGITDGGTTVSVDHEPSTSKLTLVAVQYLNTQKRAKRLELVFDRVGDAFVSRKDTESSDAHQVLDRPF